MWTFSGTLTKDFFAPFTSDFEAWCFGIEWRATASKRNKENGVKHVLECFGDAIIYLVGYDSCTGKLVPKPPPPPPLFQKKHSHKAVRHNTDPVLSRVGVFFFFAVFFLLWFLKYKMLPRESWTAVEQGSIELFLKAFWVSASLCFKPDNLHQVRSVGRLIVCVSRLYKHGTLHFVHLKYAQ